MMIRVMYSDGRFDMVNQKMLDQLITKQGVTSFKRSNGWAVIGRDPIRHQKTTSYKGQERRMEFAVA